MRKSTSIIILISNAMESRGYRRDQRALRGGDVK